MKFLVKRTNLFEVEKQVSKDEAEFIIDYFVVF